MKHSDDIINEVWKLSELGHSSRGISQIVFGTDSKKSTIQGIIDRKLKSGVNNTTYIIHDFLSPKKEYKTKEYDNSRILLISDLHIPFQHPDAFAFLCHLKSKYNPTRVICMGDELDKNSLSYHEKDPNGYSPGDELKASLPFVRELEEMFPEMDILESNHGSLAWRKAKTSGIPKEYIKSYNEVLGVSDKWKWHFDLTIDLPNGTKCYLHHGKVSDITKMSQQSAMSASAGHFHEKFKIEYWANSVGLYWAMQTGCLIDDKAYAFNYNNVNIKRPIIGTGLIIDSLPILEPMVLDGRGRWGIR